MLEIVTILVFVCAVALLIQSLKAYAKDQQWIDNRRKRGMWIEDDNDEI
jgi:hypothetical protein